MVEAVPNISEGRDSAAIETIAAAFEGHGARVLHVDPNPDANRTVITLAGPLSAVEQALFDGISMAVEHIDMRTQTGAHIRIGAADVVPIVPLSGGGRTMVRCAEAAQRLSLRLAGELSLPVYLYENAAKRTAYRSLPRCRRGGYERLRSRFSAEEAEGPDLGPSCWSDAVARSGASVVGARDLLVAMNFTLDSRDEELARSVARALRTNGEPARPHRLRHLRAVGWTMPGYEGRVQVSTNLLDARETPVQQVLEAVRRLAGVEVLGAELIGLIPARSLRDAGLFARGEPVPEWPATQVLDPAAAAEDELLAEGARYLGLDHLGGEALFKSRVLEWRLREAGF